MGAGELTPALKAEAGRLGFVGCAVATAEPLVETRVVIAARVDRGSSAGLPWFTVERADRSTEPAPSRCSSGRGPKCKRRHGLGHGPGIPVPGRHAPPGAARNPRGKDHEY